MRKSTRSRRLVARVAVAGALAAVPLAAVAGPALADTTAPSATQVDRHHDDWDHHNGPGFPGIPGPDWNHGWDHHDWDHGLPGFPGWNHGWNHGPWAPPTGSAG
ncbi:hypothetical protein K7711_19970 [Nocardia sp. CA2R105]|uniref:hypothetical protein n=1 Tax=Nocardia coffeae TaxID=2873381 RepID=UPI001CA66B55|nr:hypothetical protein [Nocardia coffeae]MBY8858762.1 hypothetical protein [Nocardia coffeae]